MEQVVAESWPAGVWNSELELEGAWPGLVRVSWITVAASRRRGAIMSAIGQALAQPKV